MIKRWLRRRAIRAKAREPPSPANVVKRTAKIIARVQEVDRQSHQKIFNDLLHQAGTQAMQGKPVRLKISLNRTPEQVAARVKATEQLMERALRRAIIGAGIPKRKYAEARKVCGQLLEAVNDYGDDRIATAKKAQVIQQSVIKLLGVRKGELLTRLLHQNMQAYQKRFMSEMSKYTPDLSKPDFHN